MINLNFILSFVRLCSSFSPSDSHFKGSARAITSKAARPSPPPTPLALPKCLVPSDDGTIKLIINAKPNSKISAITGIDDDGISVQIGAPAVEGQANEELIAFMAEVLGLKKRELDLDKGSRSRSKVLVVSGGKDPEEILAALRISIRNSE